MFEVMPVFDADAHVVEPGDLFSPFTRGRRYLDLPETTPVLLNGRVDVAADQLRCGFDSASYLRAMDAEGIDAAVLYPSLGLWVPFMPQLEPKESADACRRYNEWIGAYCSDNPERLYGAGLVPYVDPYRAAAEIEVISALGLVAVLFRPNHIYGRNPGDPAYDPLFAEISEAGLVLAVHEGLGLIGATTGADRFSGFAARHACSHPLEQMCALTSLVFDGALERHPKMRVAVLESGSGWLPYWLDRLDSHFELMRDTECAGLSLKPSEYFHRQCVVCTDPDDHLASLTAAQIGAERLMFASDFPHPEALFPDAVKTFVTESTRAGMDTDTLRTVLWDTATSLYGVRQSDDRSRRRRGSSRKAETNSALLVEEIDVRDPDGSMKLGEGSIAFLSPDWISEVAAIQSEYSDLVVPEALKDVAVNVTLSDIDGDACYVIEGAPGGYAIRSGQVDDAAAAVRMPARVLRAVLVDGDQGRAMGAFMAGEIEIDGDIAALLALQQVGLEASKSGAGPSKRIQSLTLRGEP